MWYPCKHCFSDNFRMQEQSIKMSVKHTGRFIMLSVITNIYNKIPKGPTLMELFTATGKLKKFSLTTGHV